MAEYGARKVYDKNGKYIGLACWRRPTDEITPEERKFYEERFSRACHEFMKAPTNPNKPKLETYSEKVEMTPELAQLIENTCQTGRINNDEYYRAIGGV